MRQILTFFLVAVMLVSHGAASGVVPHAEAEHFHSHDGEHSPIMASNSVEKSENVGVDLPTSDDKAPAPAAHSHVAAGLLESNSLFASYQRSRDLPLASEMPRLTGRDIAPAPEPPSA